jgi:hypothetical protein
MWTIPLDTTGLTTSNALSASAWFRSNGFSLHPYDVTQSPLDDDIIRNPDLEDPIVGQPFLLFKVIRSEAWGEHLVLPPQVYDSAVKEIQQQGTRTVDKKHIRHKCVLQHVMSIWVIEYRQGNQRAGHFSLTPSPNSVHELIVAHNNILHDSLFCLSSIGGNCASD